jgi:pimeloyl-ACP methyl ester carboxylesterase
MAAFLRRLASFSRVMLHDARGTGMSERPPGIATLEERMDDVRAVMDACQSNRAVVFGAMDGVPLAILFAAIHPERTRALILYGGRAAYAAREDYPWAEPLEKQQRDVEASGATIDQTWGTKQAAREIMQSIAPSAQDDETFATWLAELQRIGASPAAEIAQRRMNLEIDVRRVLSAVQAPTLVLHRTVDLEANIGESRYIADHIPGATFEELPGVDHLLVAGDQEPVVAAIERFVRGSAGVEAPAPAPEAKLATVVWSETEGVEPTKLLEAAQQAVEPFHGRVVTGPANAGAGIAAVFDGAARAIRYAAALAAALAGPNVVVRSGVQTGVLENGDQAAGPPLAAARQLATLARPDQILATDQTRALAAGSGLRFAPASLTNADAAGDDTEVFLVERDSLA